MNKAGCILILFNKLFKRGALYMREAVGERAAKLGEYIAQNKTTVRKAASVFHVSKSTVHTAVAI